MTSAIGMPNSWSRLLGLRSQLRCFKLEGGYLSWWSPAGGHVVTLDLAVTPVEVEVVKRPEGQVVMIRPTKGGRWAPTEFHSRAGTDRELVIDVSPSKLPCSFWAERLAEHIEFANQRDGFFTDVASRFAAWTEGKTKKHRFLPFGEENCASLLAH